MNDDGFSDLIVGSPYFATVRIGEGRAEIFFGAGDPPAATDRPVVQRAASRPPTTPGPTAPVGDLNGDGYSDVAARPRPATTASPTRASSTSTAARPYGLYYATVWAGEQSVSNFGYSVAAAGDVNGDGYGDIIIGAPTTGAAGKAYVWLGGPSGPSSGAADWSASFGTSGAQFGISVASAGDVNGDGYGDVIIGAHNDENDQTDEGRAYVFLGSAAGLATSPARDLRGGPERRAPGQFGGVGRRRQP